MNDYVVFRLITTSSGIISTTPLTTSLVAEYPFCTTDRRYKGSVGVLEVSAANGVKTIGLRLTVAGQTVPISRNRAKEVIEALQHAAEDASARYQQLLRKMNKHE